MRVSPLLSRARPVPVAARATLARASSHDHHPASASDEVYPEEGAPLYWYLCPPSADVSRCAGFNSPIWRNLTLGALAVALAYRLAPASAPVTEENPSPITTYLAAQMPEAGLWKARAAKHLELAKEAADDKLLFQEAERPKVRRLRYLGCVFLPLSDSTGGVAVCGRGEQRAQQAEHVGRGWFAGRDGGDEEQRSQRKVHAW